MSTPETDEGFFAGWGQKKDLFLRGAMKDSRENVYSLHALPGFIDPGQDFYVGQCSSADCFARYASGKHYNGCYQVGSGLAGFGYDISKAGSVAIQDLWVSLMTQDSPITILDVIFVYPIAVIGGSIATSVIGCATYGTAAVTEVLAIPGTAAFTVSWPVLSGTTVGSYHAGRFILLSAWQTAAAPLMVWGITRPSPTETTASFWMEITPGGQLVRGDPVAVAAFEAQREKNSGALTAFQTAVTAIGNTDPAFLENDPRFLAAVKAYLESGVPTPIPQDFSQSKGVPYPTLLFYCQTIERACPMTVTE